MTREPRRGRKFPTSATPSIAERGNAGVRFGAAGDPVIADALRVFLDAALEWAERRTVSTTVWRSPVPTVCAAIYDPIIEWRVSLHFRDALGAFRGTLPVFRPYARESEHDYVVRVARAIDRVCVEARRSRAREVSSIDPARGTAIAARQGTTERERRRDHGSRGGRPPGCIYESDPLSFVSR
jgi:hypothetical protein